MHNSILKTKSYAFALDVIIAYKAIICDKKEYTISKQFLRSGTAPGALIREAEYAQSKADFISKLSIALKESNETDYWISLMKDADILNKEVAFSLELENREFNPYAYRFHKDLTKQQKRIIFLSLIT